MSRLLPLLTWLAFPVYVWQGLGVRRRTERMLPARGPVLHRIEGKEPAISLLVLGDSSAASVGIGRSEDGLAAQLALLDFGNAPAAPSPGARRASTRRLRPDPRPCAAQPVGRAVDAHRAFHRHQRHQEFSFRAALQEGFRRPALRAARQMAGGARRLVAGDRLHPRAGAAAPARHVFWKSAPAQSIAMGERLCHERGAVPRQRLPIADPQAGFSTDGFHASEAGYRAWAEHMLGFVLAD